MRCVDPKCPFRTSQADEALDEPGVLHDENQDIPDEDKEFGDFDPRDTVEEDDEEELEMAVSKANSSMAAPGKAVNIFPFASPITTHTRTLVQVLDAPSATHLLLLTRTAHPGLIVAAREHNLEVIAWVTSETSSPPSRAGGERASISAPSTWKRRWV